MKKMSNMWTEKRKNLKSLPDEIPFCFMAFLMKKEKRQMK